MNNNNGKQNGCAATIPGIVMLLIAALWIVAGLVVPAARIKLCVIFLMA